MNPQELLKKYGLSPKHIFGQNFLVDESALDKIVAAADVQVGDFVIEIGPGVGNLTRKLLEVGAQVMAVEKDENFKPILRKLGKEFPGKLDVVYRDALNVDYGGLVKRPLDPSASAGVRPLPPYGHHPLARGGEYRIIGNIPYYITGKLIPKLLALEPRPESITLLVQKEVAERMAARPGQMSLLSLAAQLKSTPILEFMVSSKAFWPEPKVDSAVVRLQVTGYSLQVKDLNQDLEKQLFKLAKAAFRGKRKTLLNSLSSNLNLPKEKVETALKSCDIDPKTRPQELSVRNWQDLTKVLTL